MLSYALTVRHIKPFRPLLQWWCFALCVATATNKSVAAIVHQTATPTTSQHPLMFTRGNVAEVSWPRTQQTGMGRELDCQPVVHRTTKSTTWAPTKFSDLCIIVKEKKTMWLFFFTLQENWSRNQKPELLLSLLKQILTAYMYANAASQLTSKNNQESGITSSYHDCWVLEDWFGTGTNSPCGAQISLWYSGSRCYLSSCQWWLEVFFFFHSSVYTDLHWKKTTTRFSRFAFLLSKLHWLKFLHLPCTMQIMNW